MTPDQTPHTQLAEQVAELKKELAAVKQAGFAAILATCTHHNDEERSEAGCPVCRLKQIAELKAEVADLKALNYGANLNRLEEAQLFGELANEQIAALKGELADSSEQLLFANIRGDTAKTLLSGLVEALKLNLTAEQLEFLTGDPRAKAAFAGAEGKAPK